MHLEYLLFDFTDDDTGACSFDAMASVDASRIPPLLHEIEAVLAWSHRGFGPASGAGDEGEWDFELQATLEPDTLLPIAYGVERARIDLPRVPAGRITITLTLSGSRAFGAAFREAFPEAD